MPVKKGNKILTLSVEPEKVKELKIKAIKANMTISEFMVKSASEYDPSRIVASHPLNDSSLKNNPLKRE